MIRILEVNNIDLPGKRFNGYDFLDEPALSNFDIKQFVIEKQSKNAKVICNNKIKNLFYRLQEYESYVSIHNVFSISSNEIFNLPEYKEAEIIHFHMFHNTKLSIASLIRFASEKKVILSFHDPWFLTGRCVHFYECQKWQVGCKNCNYLSTLFPFEKDNCNLMWNLKKDTLSKLDIDIVVPTKWMYNLVKQSPFFKNNNIHLIPFGIDLEKFKPRNKKESRKKLGIKNNNIVLFFRAQNEFKGTEYIVEALENYKTSKDITLLTCDNIGIIDSLKTKYQVIELGLVDDEKLIIAYDACDIFLMPSKGESFGMMAIEAMAMEKPVVVFDNSALPFVTHAPECGYLVKNKDANDLQKAVDYLINNKDECQKRGKLGRKICIKEYQYDKYINNISKLYTSVYNRDAKYFVVNKKCNNRLVDNIFNSIDEFITNNKFIEVDNNLKKLSIYDINKINDLIYDKYILNNSPIKISLRQRVKGIIKKSKLVRKIYNFLK